MTAVVSDLKARLGADLTAGDSVATALGMATYAGDPTNNLVPAHIGQFCMDTVGAHLYWASSAAAAGWKKLNN